MALALATGCAGVRAGRATAPASASVETASFAASPSSGFSDVNTDKSLITNGSVTATSTDLLAVASDFRREVTSIGARVVAEQLHYDDLHSELRQRPHGSSSASYSIKLLPSALPTLLDWLREHAIITEEDVTSIAAMESQADADLTRSEVENRIAEIDRQLSMSVSEEQRATLQAEREALAGSSTPNPIAAAADTRRVAVLRVSLQSPPQYDPLAHGDIVASVRGSFLGLNVLGASSTGRLGVGVALAGRSPESALEVTGYASTATSRTAITASAGVGGYSAAFGNGERTTFNPFLGFRVGYAYVDASYFTAAVDVGIELVKRGGIVWTASARPTVLLGSDSQLAVEVGTSLGIAF